jgi:hypothetical protein
VPQRAYIPKEDAALPTISTKLVFITSAIATSEKRPVRCYSIPSAFVNTDVDENVLLVLKGKLAEMMVHIAPQIYQNYITVDRKGMPMLYMKLQRCYIDSGGQVYSSIGSYTESWRNTNSW